MNARTALGQYRSCIDVFASGATRHKFRGDAAARTGGIPIIGSCKVATSGNRTPSDFGTPWLQRQHTEPKRRAWANLFCVRSASPAMHRPAACALPFLPTASAGASMMACVACCPSGCARCATGAMTRRWSRWRGTITLRPLVATRARFCGLPLTTRCHARRGMAAHDSA